ncbi:RRM domain containing protein [Cryptosporidium parvum Iowa II]|uniref:Nuclear cap-binding protein subunit 2 n=2 Tax=Cryptosporidium parvum TaxID=5807 RepID=Q5CXB8_CRYPI|nr:RRM domain containing protein [Cryptosporidium parvum Iowa II]QOY41050.1 Nuclear cap-binding protein subunit 2 [Cryptosporidium parvum]WKS78279.1 RRM domain-containing protein [Cryptosporidium sp. 43IA8]EAK89839.1 RRM domain containing protein [Cryptosporidium parvum Iowa II]WRK32769.1 Nuclear cap-binding protein subunit 2 [Cryptosporidium parvum]CAD98713.1 nuclear cap-binding protein, possible [Cryptosporidium parvum]|eukprot:QOY41050.1 hypothetical protein CPATCC_002692 [Cryptosporidium parvum]
MSYLFHAIGHEYSYFDKKNYSKDDWIAKISKSTTVYVGNLSFFTTEEIISEVFGLCGPIKAIYLGLNHQTMQPCGFCFVQYYSHADALTAVTFLNRSYCDGREIRVDWDSGEDISGSRRYGRGNSGFQWRDELRNQIDPDRQLDVVDTNNHSKSYKFSHGSNSSFHRRHPGGRGRNSRGTFNISHYNRQIKHKHQVFDQLKNTNGSHDNYPDY